MVTGAGQGIGAAAARLLGREGARVFVNDLDPSLAEATAVALRNAGCEADFLGGSIVDEEFPEKMVDHAAKRFGPPDIVVNNAGINLGVLADDWVL